MASHLAGAGWPSYDIPSAAVVRGAPSREAPNGNSAVSWAALYLYAEPAANLSCTAPGRPGRRPEDIVTVAATPAVWTGLDHLAPDAALDFVRELETLGFGGFWTREGVGREPFALLAAAAGVTSGLRLGTAIANVYCASVPQASTHL